MKINVNIKKRILEFPEDLVDVAMMIIEDIESGKKTRTKIEDNIKNEIRELIHEGESQ